MANKPHSRAYKRILSGKWITYPQTMLERSETLKTRELFSLKSNPI